LLGPNTGVAGGEVTSSLLGPFVGFHHKPPLTPPLWPDAPATWGTAPTGGPITPPKHPDKGFCPAKGSSPARGGTAKFPPGCTRAPCSILARGVTTLPQKVIFPFSLINAPSARFQDVSTALNEIIPAWLLTDNLFTLKRNEAKFRQRNRARRTQFDFELF